MRFYTIHYINVLEFIRILYKIYEPNLQFFIEKQIE